MITGVDYAWTHPSIPALQAGGYRFASRYLSRDPSKNLTKAEADQLHAAGIATASNWEYAIDAALKGAPQGTADARDAAAQHAACGGPAGRPIYFSCDIDPRTFTTAQWAAVDAYYRAIAASIGLERTGAYGGYALIKHLFDKGLIRWGWQTYAWSGGQWDPRAQVRQVQNGVTIGGADCDINNAMTVDYGQWGVAMAGSGITMKWGESLDDYLSRIEKVWVPGANAAAALPARLDAVASAVAAIQPATPAAVDPAALAAALASDNTFVQALAAALASHIKVA